MYRVELKDPGSAQVGEVISMFLMYRVELKEFLLPAKLQNRGVPNVPCGVERMHLE